jgi:hypothetical protein
MEPFANGRDAPLKTRLLQVVSGAQFYLGRYSEALALLDDLEKLAHGNPDRQSAVWNNRAVLLASQGNYQANARVRGALRAPRCTCPTWRSS